MITINSIPNSQKSSDVDTLEFKVESNEILARLCGPLESNIAHLEIAFDAQLSRKGNTIFIKCGKRVLVRQRCTFRFTDEVKIKNIFL